jgi:hypothetical protein
MPQSKVERAGVVSSWRLAEYKPPAILVFSEHEVGKSDSGLDASRLTAAYRALRQ